MSSRGAQCPAPATAAPVTPARRLASGVLRLRPALTSASVPTREIPGLSPRAIQYIGRRAEVPGVDDLRRHVGLADERVEPRLVERRRAAVHVAADVWPQVQQYLVADRARAGDRVAARVGHDAEPVLLSAA